MDDEMGHPHGYGNPQIDEICDWGKGQNMSKPLKTSTFLWNEHPCARVQQGSRNLTPSLL